MIGNISAQPTARRSSATRMFISRSCSASQSAYSDRRKNVVTAEQSNTPSSETPLHREPVRLSAEKLQELGEKPHYMESTDERLDLRHGLGLLLVR